jgi:tripartite ATP-independent transporter DctP family solute receptor
VEKEGGGMKHWARILVFSWLLTSGVAALAQETRLRLAHTQPESDSQHVALVRFAQLVRERTRGQVRIEVFHSGQLGNDGAIIAATRGAVIDLSLTGNPFFAGINPKQSALDLPGIIRSFGHAYNVLDGPVGNEIRLDLEQYGLKALGFLEIGFRNLTNSRRPVIKLEDMAGLKIRTTPNPAHLKAFQLVGVNPVPMAYTEVYTALETRTVDGQENPITLIYSAKFYEVQKHLTLTQHAYTAAPFVMNLKKFQSLSPAAQNAMETSATEVIREQRAANRKIEEGDLTKLRAAGMQVVTDFPRAEFRNKVYGPVKEDYVAKFGDKLIEAIEKTAD